MSLAWAGAAEVFHLGLPMSWATCAIAALAVLVVCLAFAPRARRAPPPGFLPIPPARGGVPVLGHALAYQRGPAEFVADQCRSVGPIFRVNLAGKRMVVVGNSPALLSQLARQPERVLSARAAVAQVGFEQTLGAFSVRRGTDLHKRILKTMLAGGGGGGGGGGSGGGGLAAETPGLLAALRAALDAELLAMAHEQLPGQSGDAAAATPPPPTTTTATTSVPGRDVVVPDLLALVRRVVLRATLERLVGRALAAAGGAALVTAFMEFQDAVEDATAKAAVLPRVLALPLVLWPCAARRRRLTSWLASLIAAAFTEADRSAGGHGDCRTDAAADCDGLGPWLRAVRDPANGVSVQQGAELVVSLLFAAHKNPAIGAAQAFLFMTQPPAGRAGHSQRRGGSQRVGGGGRVSVGRSSSGSGDDRRDVAPDPHASELALARREARALLVAAESVPSSGPQGVPPTGRPGAVVVTALRRCRALRRCCLETLRLTAHTLGALRVVTAPVDLHLPAPATAVGVREAGAGGAAAWGGTGACSFRVCAGETVALSHVASSWDERAWGADARQYNPRRREWLRVAGAAGREDAENTHGGGGGGGGGNDDDDDDDDVRLTSCCAASGPGVGGLSAYKMTAFSHGVHVCPGQRLAVATMQCTLALLLDYGVRLTHALPELSFERATLAQRAGPVQAAVPWPPQRADGVA